MTARPFDVLVEVACENDDRLLSHWIRCIPGFCSTESFVYLRLRKQTYGWATR